MQYGYFDHERDEYVVQEPDVPVSWTNYLGVKDLCAVISHNAGGYAFYKSAQHHRITRFRQNGVPMDRPGHYVYLRDDESGDYWSLSWQPVGKPLDAAEYECRHGLSYSKFRCRYQDIDAEQKLFIPVDDAVLLWDVRLVNKGTRTRTLSVFSFVEFSFHHIDIDNQNLQMSLYASGSSFADGIIEYDFFYEPWTAHFFTASFDPFASQGDATVYEHLKRALDFSAEHVGQNGVCKGLRADWNDCLNLGGGESALVTFLHAWALRSFLDLAAHLGRDTDVQQYAALAERIRAVANRELWDGQWYVRGFTKDGRKIGSATSREGRVFLEHMGFAIMSGSAPHDRGLSAMDAVNRHLYSKFGLHLLWPAFSEPDDGIGYVTRVYKGIKENGAIFSHPNSWAIIAECLLGRGDRAMKFYDAILPYNQNDMIDVRQAEPYSYCQFVMGRDHTAHGRARHPWLTGTAGWMYTAATRYILGVRVGFDGLIVDPCIPASWDGFEVSRQWRGARYDIKVTNPDRVQKGIRSLMLNGESISGPVPPQSAGSVNQVMVVMGAKR